MSELIRFLIRLFSIRRCSTCGTTLGLGDCGKCFEEWSAQQW